LRRWIELGVVMIGDIGRGSPGGGVAVEWLGDVFTRLSKRKGHPLALDSDRIGATQSFSIGFGYALPLVTSFEVPL